MGARKILFPLEMQNGEKVHTLEELREKFDLERILTYVDSGQLVRWLRDRQAVEMAEKIAALDKGEEEYERKLCEAILGEANEGILEQIKNVKLKKERAEKEAAEQTRIEAEKKKSEFDDLLVDGIREGLSQEKGYGFDTTDPIGSIASKAVTDTSFIENPVQCFVGTKYENEAQTIIEKLYAHNELDIECAKQLVLLARKKGMSVHESFGCLCSGLEQEDFMNFENICRMIFVEKVQSEKGKRDKSKEAPTLLVDSTSIYVVDGNRLIVRKTCIKHGRNIDFDVRNGVVQEGNSIYYIKNVSKVDFHSENHLCKLDSNTGEEEQLCEMEYGDLWGVRNHKLFYVCTPVLFPGSMKIVEMNLDTLQRKSHEIEVKNHLVIRHFGDECNNKGDCHIRRNYPCIDEDGKHIYCRMDRKYRNDPAYIVDIDLETDKIEPLISLREQVIDNWGIGRNGFVVRYIYGIENCRQICKIVYYDMTTKRKQELTQFEEIAGKLAYSYPYWNECICCEEGRIFWLFGLITTGAIRLMEYTISTGEFIERVCLKRTDIDYVREIFVSHHYLYIYDWYKFRSWRFSMDDWKPERLEKIGSEYQYVPVEINA